MICPNCKNQINDNDEFCSLCGESIDSSIKHLSVEEASESGYKIKKLNKGEAEAFGHKVDITVKESDNDITYTQTIRYGGFFYLGPLVGVVGVGFAMIIFMLLFFRIIQSLDGDIATIIITSIVFTITIIGLCIVFRIFFKSFKEGLIQKKKYKQLIKEGIVKKKKVTFPNLLYRTLIGFVLLFLLMLIVAALTSIIEIDVPETIYSHFFIVFGISFALCACVYIIIYFYYLFVNKINLFSFNDKHK